MDLILASQSPQRQKILTQMGLRFRAIPAHIDEHHSGYRKPHAIAKSIALRKAKAIAKKHPEAWVIGCDTIVVLSDGRIAVKPRHLNDARSMLEAYQDSFCNVYSGLALVREVDKTAFVTYERSKIIFNRMKKSELADYLKSGEWKGRSGAITIETAEPWVKRIEGEYWNIVGLPVDRLKKALKDHHLV